MRCSSTSATCACPSRLRTRSDHLDVAQLGSRLQPYESAEQVATDANVVMMELRKVGYKLAKAILPELCDECKEKDVCKQRARMLSDRIYSTGLVACNSDNAPAAVNVHTRLSADGHVTDTPHQEPCLMHVMNIGAGDVSKGAQESARMRAHTKRYLARVRAAAWRRRRAPARRAPRAEDAHQGRPRQRRRRAPAEPGRHRRRHRRRDPRSSTKSSPSWVQPTKACTRCTTACSATLCDASPRSSKWRSREVKGLCARTTPAVRRPHARARARCRLPGVRRGDACRRRRRGGGLERGDERHQRVQVRIDAACWASGCSLD